MLVCIALACAFFKAPQKVWATDTHDHAAWTVFTGNEMLDSGNFYLDGDVSGSFTVSGNVTLCLNGHRLSSSGGSVITVNENADFTLCDCNSETQHKYYLDANGKYVFEEGTLSWLTAYTNASERGSIAGGVICGGTGTSDTGAVFGGGIYVKGGQCAVEGGTVAGNAADYGSICVKSGTLVINGGTVVGNTAKYGAVYVFEQGALTVNGGYIGGGANADYGSICVKSGTLVINDGTVVGNAAKYGAVYIFEQGALTVDGGYIGGSIGKESDTASVLIRRGNFSSDPGTDGLLEGYYVTELTPSDEEYREGFPFAVRFLAAEVEFDGVTRRYEDIESAFSAAGKAETSAGMRAKVTLFTDVTLSQYLPVYSEDYITFDLNGHMLRMAGKSTVIKIDGNLILCDSGVLSEHPYYADDNGQYRFDDGSEEWEAAFSQAFESAKGIVCGGVITGGSGMSVNIIGTTGSIFGGGGVVVQENAFFTMTGGTIAGNCVSGSSTSSGGGVLVIGTYRMEGGTIAGNIALEGGNHRYGGGVYVSGSGAFTMTGGTICENTALAGGGVFFSGTEANITGGTIARNRVLEEGSGTYAGQGAAILSMDRSTINMANAEIDGDIYLYLCNTNFTDCTVDSDLITLDGGSLYIHGGYIRSEFKQKETVSSDISIDDGYFAIQPAQKFIADGHILIAWGEKFGDEGYSEEFPYAVYAFSTESLFAGSKDEIVYNGDPIAAGTDFLINNSLAVAELFYSYKEKDGTEYSAGLPCNAGTYIVQAEMLDTEKKTYYCSEMEISIGWAVPPVSDLPSETLTITYGMYLFDVDLPAEENGAWKWEEENRVWTPGEYSTGVVFMPDDAQNYQTVRKTIQLTVEKADPEYSVPEEHVDYYGTALGEIGLPSVSNGVWSWKDDLYFVPDAGEHSFEAVFTPYDGQNYNTITAKVSVKILPVVLGVNFPTVLEARYGDTLEDIEIPASEDGEWRWDDPSASVGDVGQQSFCMTFIPYSSNYTIEYGEVVVIVAKADPVVDVPEGLVGEEGQTLSEIILPEGWKWKDGTILLDQAGEVLATVVYTPQDTANYNLLEVSVIIDVEGKERGGIKCFSSAGAVEFMAGALVLLGACVLIFRKKCK